MKRILKYFSLFELVLWIGSMILMITVFYLFNNTEYLYLIGSLIGSTAVIFVSKANPIGQLLTIIFAIFYGIISYSFKYYGEMITYLGMTAPIAFLAIIAWLKHPYQGKKSEVTVNSLTKNEYLKIMIFGFFISISFYFILGYFDTSYLIISTLSVYTSFVASYLTMKRSKHYAIAYAVNDIVLIILWTLASLSDTSYIALVICFIAFLCHDVYGYINWSRIHKKQQL
ncbi:MAG: nicotinamide riboside transporter PnuC [Acholeplasmataceae bacterium]|jgi:nicotinamide mononucleotide transporter PnuC|nr:nicotinamide riboside transporter PnuC [Acholeplasmataceae bacterium]